MKRHCTIANIKREKAETIPVYLQDKRRIITIGKTATHRFGWLKVIDPVEDRQRVTYGLVWL